MTNETFRVLATTNDRKVVSGESWLRALGLGPPLVSRIHLIRDSSEMPDFDVGNSYKLKYLCVTTQTGTVCSIQYYIRGCHVPLQLWRRESSFAYFSPVVPYGLPPCGGLGIGDHFAPPNESVVFLRWIANAVHNPRSRT